MISRIPIAMMDAGRSLVDASQDPELPDIAWRRPSFRPSFCVTSGPLLDQTEQMQG